MSTVLLAIVVALQVKLFCSDNSVLTYVFNIVYLSGLTLFLHTEVWS